MEMEESETEMQYENRETENWETCLVVQLHI